MTVVVDDCGGVVVLRCRRVAVAGGVAGVSVVVLCGLVCVALRFRCCPENLVASGYCPWVNLSHCCLQRTRTSRMASLDWKRRIRE